MQLRHWKHCEPSFGPHILRPYTPSPLNCHKPHRNIGWVESIQSYSIRSFWGSIYGDCGRHGKDWSLWICLEIGNPLIHPMVWITFFEWSPPTDIKNSYIWFDILSDLYMLAFYLAFFLTVYLTNILTFYLALLSSVGILSDIYSDSLFDILSCICSHIFLTHTTGMLPFYQALFYLTYILHVIWHAASHVWYSGVRSGILSGILTFYSCGHLLVTTGYKWDYTFYKWAYNYNWYFGP